MQLTVKYFARLREALGASEVVQIDASHADAPRTVGQLRDWLCQRSAGHARVLGHDQVLRAALNQRMVDDDQALAEGAELAFFPPVTGG